MAESVRCLGQETEQYEVFSPEFNLKYICIGSRNVEMYFYEKHFATPQLITLTKICEQLKGIVSYKNIQYILL